VAFKGTREIVFAMAAVALWGVGGVRATAQEQDQDPPSRVARLNYIYGNVSMEPASVDEWALATINRPFTTGDSLYTDQGAAAELHTDVAVMRMAENTTFGFLNLNDTTVQIRLDAGQMYFRLRNFTPDQVFEVDTPNAAIMLLRDGVYRIAVDPNGSMTFVTDRTGEAEVNGGGQAFTLNPGETAALSGSDQLAYNIEPAPAPDAFETWCERRDTHEAQLAAMRYLPPTLIGYEDLDDNGSWAVSAEYGPVWYPRALVAGWAPYRFGHWAWIEPWGWTWVDDAPWGFAPFHYGRWAYIEGRWGWCPGPLAIARTRVLAVRPYYAPALVAWFGGAHWSVSISTGGPAIGWVALGFGEIYTPAYHCSPHYFERVNIYNTRIQQTVSITNVYRTVYVQKTVYNQTFVNVRNPGAVVAVSQTAFANGRPVGQSAIAVHAAEFTRISPSPAAVLAPPVAPTRFAAAPTLARGAGRRPPATVLQHRIVAIHTPAPAPPALTATQRFVSQHAGMPYNPQAARAAAPARPERVAMVRQVRPGSAPAVQPGQHGGAPVSSSYRAEPMHSGAARANQEPAYNAAQPERRAPPTYRQPAFQQPRPDYRQPQRQPAYQQPRPEYQQPREARPYENPTQVPEQMTRPGERQFPAPHPMERNPSERINQRAQPPAHETNRPSPHEQPHAQPEPHAQHDSSAKKDDKK
jgi:hypothetical protein